MDPALRAFGDESGRLGRPPGLVTTDAPNEEAFGALVGLPTVIDLAHSRTSKGPRSTIAMKNADTSL